MSMFEERERAFEAKWAHDEEMQFRILAKRNELLGRWAGAELGLTDLAVEEYAAALIALGLKSKDTGALYLKLRSDLAPAHSEATIRAKMSDFLEAATMEAGLVQRRALGEGTATAHGSGDSNVTRADFGQILSRGDAPFADQGEGTRHVHVGRGAAAHALHHAHRNKSSR